MQFQVMWVRVMFKQFIIWNDIAISINVGTIVLNQSAITTKVITLHNSGMPSHASVCHDLERAAFKNPSKIIL